MPAITRASLRVRNGKNGMSKRVLLHGDCFDLIPGIDDKSIDLIVTDPPYEHVMGGMKCKWLNNGTWSGESYMTQKMSQFGHDAVIAFLDLVKPKMKKVNMFVFCSRLQVSHYLEWARKEKMKYDILIWDKGRKDLKSTKFFSQDIEYVIRLYEDGVSLQRVTDEQGRTKTNYYLKSQKFSQPKGIHETVKPMALIEQYIELASDVGEMVLDPFMGSGTTAIACNKLKRDFIGIEKDSKYFELAKSRIEGEVNQMSIWDFIGVDNE